MNIMKKLEKKKFKAWLDIHYTDSIWTEMRFDILMKEFDIHWSGSIWTENGSIWTESRFDIVYAESIYKGKIFDMN